MKKIYEAKLNKSTVYLVSEESNTISLVFQTLENAKLAQSGQKLEATAIAVNSEVLSFGKIIGYIKDKVEIN